MKLDVHGSRTSTNQEPELKHGQVVVSSGFLDPLFDLILWLMMGQNARNQLTGDSFFQLKCRPMIPFTIK
jgi:hypothetical protein